MTDNDECGSVSEAGDIGDRSLRRSRGSWRMVSVDNMLDDMMERGGGGSTFAITGDSEIEKPNDEVLDETSAIPGDSEIEKPKDEKREKKEANFMILNYVSCLMFLALFGILGVITRYYLQKLFGPELIGATSKQDYMYPDLPSNMVGSFLMGWLGVVFKGSISQVSENLAIGLTTGFLGSLTTFSGWNQMLLELSAEGRWVFAVLAIILGLFLAAFPIIFGVDTAKGFQCQLKKWDRNPKLASHASRWNLEDYPKLLMSTLILLFLLISIWIVCLVFEIRDFKSATDRAELLFACLVGPFGVWFRWLLARWNGQGLGKEGRLKWVPFGTLMANVLAASIMAALAMLKKAVNNHTCDVVATGIQLGFCGCLSTVSTFIAEFNAMRESSHPLRAYVYALSTIIISFVLGTIIYSVPFWMKDYD